MRAIDAWPIVNVRSLGGCWVEVTHAAGTVVRHDFTYLLNRGGVFAELTEDLISEVGIVDGGTIGWVTRYGVVDLAPDALLEHAVFGRCPGGTCGGWTRAHTVVIERGEVTEEDLL